MGEGRRQGRVARAVVALGVLAACGSSPPAPPVGSRVGPMLSAALRVFDDARAPIQCATGGKLADETLALRRTWKLAGTTATAAGTGPIAIGVIADAGGAAAATIAALGRLRAQLADADLLLVLGGMGANARELEATLGTLATDARGPVIALAGDLEPAPALTEAIAALHARKLPVFDGRHARTIELPGVVIGTLPGAGSPTRLVAGPDGCGYTSEHLSALLSELTRRPGLRILASAEAPRTTVGGEATGELAVTPGALAELDLILHGPVTELPTAARSGGRDGAAVALSPGTSDATTRLTETVHTPTAGLLVIEGTSWKWKPLVAAP